MTNFGKNIKKIRSIQKLSQTKFAEIFNISRASIGAYEEGRAEAKLDVITKIANYFSITVDDLINKEITVNKLYHFNIFDDKFSNKINIGYEVLKKIQFINIPLIISHELLINNIRECFDLADNYITLPNHSNNHLAVLIDTSGYKYLPSVVRDNDIIIVYTGFEIDKDTSLSDNFWLIKTDKSLYIGEIKRLNRDAYLFFPQDKSPISIVKKDLDFIVPIETYISHNPRLNLTGSDRLRKLELQVNDLYNRL
jgi:transcriptional regulator with XRE-family HTH domain